MNFVKLKYTGKNYAYNGASNIFMDILSNFLSSDVQCMNINFYKRWALNENHYDVTGGNITSLKKENGLAYLIDLYSEEKVPTELTMTINQFVQLLDDWDNKVCKPRPQEVTITHHNDQFIIETSNDYGMC